MICLDMRCFQGLKVPPSFRFPVLKSSFLHFVIIVFVEPVWEQKIKIALHEEGKTDSKTSSEVSHVRILLC